jgi:hypothetical protein
MTGAQDCRSSSERRWTFKNEWNQNLPVSILSSAALFTGVVVDAMDRLLGATRQLRRSTRVMEGWGACLETHGKWRISDGDVLIYDPCET